MRWALFLAVAASLLALLGMPFQKIVDDGLWPLAVTIRSTSGAPLAAATCEAFAYPEAARYSLEHALPAEPGLYTAVQQPFHGEGLTVEVPTSEKTWRGLVGQWRSYYQYQSLLVVVRYPDGHRKAVLLPIPDLRQQREVTVTVP